MSPGKHHERQKWESAPPAFLIISGWKGIAAYLGKGVRTVQRYERELGLPVRRPSGKITGSVIATKAELDAWVAASPLREASLLTRIDRGVHRNSQFALNELRALIAQTHRLRSEAIELRKSVLSSFEMLQSNLERAITRMHPTPRNHGFMLSAPERHLLADMLPFDLTKRKVI